MAQRAREEWPDVSALTAKGVDRMEEFFGQPFPFPKYDQVLLPGFAYGGMEHAGATFLNEAGVLFRTVPTSNDRARRATLVLHELAHQWFGDLVTMRWFDDLWLKEGFAQYMAYHTLAELEPAGEVWKRFYDAIKPGAYAIDSTQGTTPIYQSIANLKDAKSAYGAIVYSKAPALLHSLEFMIGESQFRQGVRLFLEQHAWSNAEWNDLVHAFSTAAERNLEPWAAAWVQHRGMPEVAVDWACAGDRITRFEITQKDVLGTDRTWPIDTELLLHYRDGNPVLLKFGFADSKSPVPGALGRACPDYVFANHGDHAYGRFLLDDVSRERVIATIGDVQNPLERALLWGSVWDAVRELQMAPVEYIQLAMERLPAESDAEITATTLGRTATAYTRYLSDAQRAALAEKLEAFEWDRLHSSATADLRITYFRSLLGIATRAETLTDLKKMLAGEGGIPGVPFKQRDRWSILETLVARRDPDAVALAKTESARDKTEDGRKYAYAALAGAPDPLSKSKYFGEFVNDPKIREDWIVTAAPDFNDWTQSSLTLRFLRPALAALPIIKRERKIFFALNWLNAFIGGQQSSSAQTIVNNYLKQEPLDADLRLKVLEVKDALDRAVRIQARYGRS